MFRSYVLDLIWCPVLICLWFCYMLFYFIYISNVSTEEWTNYTSNFTFYSLSIFQLAHNFMLSLNLFGLVRGSLLPALAIKWKLENKKTNSRKWNFLPLRIRPIVILLILYHFVSFLSFRVFRLLSSSLLLFFNVSADISSGLLQVFVELGNFQGTSTNVLYSIPGGHLFWIRLP